MARIPLIDGDDPDADPAARAMLARVRQSRGIEANVYRGPEGLFPPDEAAVVVFSRKSTLMQPMDDATWTALTDHFGIEQVMEIIFTCGLNQMVSRFHAAVRTDVDESTLDQVAHSCPVPLPPPTAEASEAG